MENDTKSKVSCASILWFLAGLITGANITLYVKNSNYSTTVTTCNKEIKECYTTLRNCYIKTDPFVINKTIQSKRKRK